MEWFILAVVVVGFLWFRANQRANRIVNLRAEELAAATGRSAESIAADMRRRRMTPGDWARENGLDPMTFEPREAGSQAPSGRDVTGKPLGTLDEMQSEVDAGMQAKREELETVKSRIAAIDESLSNALGEGLLLAEMEELQNERERLDKERVRLERFFWLARGGDQSGEPPPE